MPLAIGYMLFKGTDDKPVWFCGYRPPLYAPTFDREGNPAFFHHKTLALAAWEELERQGHQVELMQITTGYCQHTR